jgi:hypothetical protein
MNKTEDDQVDGRRTVTAIDYPAVFGIEVRHVPNAGPGTEVVTAVPGSVNGNVGEQSSGLGCRCYRLGREPTEDCGKEKKKTQQNDSSWHFSSSVNFEPKILKGWTTES